MKKYASVFLLMVFSFPIVSFAGFFEKGKAAYDKKDYQKAFEMFTPLADNGDAKAQLWLGIMYANGKYVKKNDIEAVKWYRKAAEQLEAGAQNNLGVMYDKGRGVPQDNVMAHMWWSLAASFDQTGEVRDLAVKNRDSVAKKMTPQQIAEAERLAGEWAKMNAQPAEKPSPSPSVTAEKSVRTGRAFKQGKIITADSLVIKAQMIVMDKDSVEYNKEFSENRIVLGLDQVKEIQEFKGTHKRAGMVIGGLSGLALGIVVALGTKETEITGGPYIYLKTTTIQTWPIYFCTLIGQIIGFSIGDNSEIWSTVYGKGAELPKGGGNKEKNIGDF